MLVIRIEEWPGGDADHRRPIARIDVANRTGLAPVSDYEVVLRPTVGDASAPAMVYGHRRDDGWLPLARAALRAVDPHGGFYTSPSTQVPAGVLALLPLAPYTSRACQTGRAILAARPWLDAVLDANGLEREAWAAEFFASCRGTEKWTGMRCQDPQHGDRCSTCGVLVEQYGMVLHYRAVHVSAEQLAEGAPPCTWPSCLPDAQQQQLAIDLPAILAGESRPMPDPRPACGCVEPADLPASRTWTVTTTVTAPTPEDAERWAGGIAQMVQAEFGDSMRLDVTVAPVVPETPGAALQRRQLERGMAMLAGDDAPDSDAGAIAGEEQILAHTLALEEAFTPEASRRGAADGG
jgi:hypothetical protein